MMSQTHDYKRYPERGGARRGRIEVEPFAGVSSAGETLSEGDSATEPKDVLLVCPLVHERTHVLSHHYAPDVAMRVEIEHHDG